MGVQPVLCAFSVLDRSFLWTAAGEPPPPCTYIYVYQSNGRCFWWCRCRHSAVVFIHVNGFETKKTKKLIFFFVAHQSDRYGSGVQFELFFFFFFIKDAVLIVYFWWIIITKNTWFWFLVPPINLPGRSLTLLCPAEDAYIPFLTMRKVTKRENRA